MMTNAHDPVFPNIGDHAGPDMPGLTAIEHAAIHTGQPCSGTPWLDEMIRAQRRERLAGQALAGILVEYAEHGFSVDECSKLALDAAASLIAALEGGAK